MAYCKNCGVAVDPQQAICVKCGVKLGTGASFCAHCGSPLNPGADVCLNCGFAVKNAVAGGDLGGKDTVTMALICFFLGAIGIHNFMLGETKKGVFKIVMAFCFGISSILALIDFIKILTDKYVVDPTKLI